MNKQIISELCHVLENAWCIYHQNHNNNDNTKTKSKYSLQSVFLRFSI